MVLMKTNYFHSEGVRGTSAADGQLTCLTGTGLRVFKNTSMIVHKLPLLPAVAPLCSRAGHVTWSGDPPGQGDEEDGSSLMVNLCTLKFCQRFSSISVACLSVGCLS